MNKKRVIKIIAIILLLILSVSILSGCGGGIKKDKYGRRICPNCGGAGYVRNGAKTAAEYAIMKKECPTCHGKGRLD